MSNHAVLNPAEHGELRIDTAASAELGDNVMACATVPAEFRSVQAHYPIVLRRDLATGKLEALALLGFETGENLFLRDGAWDAAYRPLSMAIRPFLIGRPATPDAVPQVHVDLDHPRISRSGEGVRVFDASGQPTPYLEDIAAKLGDLDHAYRESADFFAALDRYELAEILHPRSDARRWREELARRLSHHQRGEALRPRRRGAAGPDGERASRADLHDHRLALALR